MISVFHKEHEIILYKIEYLVFIEICKIENFCSELTA